jgi:exonuclease VII large subunit
MRTMTTIAFAAMMLPVGAAAQGATIAPAQAKIHVGQTVTVEGPVSNVFVTRTGAVFIDIGGRYPDNAFTAVVFPRDSVKFHGLSALNGKTVDINGAVKLYQDRPEIVLTSEDQLKAK